MTRHANFTCTLLGLVALGFSGCSSNEPPLAGENAGTGGDPPAAGSGGSTSGGAGTGGDPAHSAGESASGGADDVGGAGGEGASSERPYAHVTAVSTSGSDGDFTFSVSVESADIDCSQFANFWEVLTEDGRLVYRRIVEHSHTDENGTSDADKPGNTFTRSGGPVEIASDTLVVVRAHLNTGGYNGQVLRGSVTTGFAPAPDITSDFAADVEDDAPQPTGCDF